MTSYQPMTVLLCRDDEGGFTQYITGALEGETFRVILGITETNKAVLMNPAKLTAERAAWMLQAAVNGLLNEDIEKNYHKSGDDE